MKINSQLLLFICLNILIGQVDYQTQIQTIFTNNCTSCHMYGNTSGGLTLTSYTGVMTNSNSGASVVPGDHANSLLWQKVNSGQMPPQNNPDLTSDEVDLIAQWIDEGALEIVGCVDGEVELWGECYSVENTTELDLSYIGVTGEIPPEIGNLINLSSLILKENQLSGEIPPEISYLMSLTQLDLGGNQLSGEIPPEIGSLTNLNILDLAGNQLTGTLPPEIGNLENLTELELGGNQVMGAIPSDQEL